MVKDIDHPAVSTEERTPTPADQQQPGTNLRTWTRPKRTIIHTGETEAATNVGADGGLYS